MQPVPRTMWKETREETEQGHGARLGWGLGWEPRPRLPPDLQRGRSWELFTQFSGSSTRQAAAVTDFITVFSLAPGFTLKVKFGKGGGCSELTPLGPAGGV